MGSDSHLDRAACCNSYLLSRQYVRGWSLWDHIWMMSVSPIGVSTK